MITNYSKVLVFTKHTDIIPYFESRYHDCAESNRASLSFNRLKQSYARDRDVQLILLVRYEQERVFCRIRCPINPLPIRGEFEVVSLHHIVKHLNNDGWAVIQKLPLSLLK